MDHSELASYYPYSWHQSHDQATLLIIVPHSVNEDNIEIVLDRDHIVAGVRGQEPIIKGKLYGPVDPSNSVWQLEPREQSGQRREQRTRTISATSTVSSQSSYAYVSDPELLTSFSGSLDNNLTSDGDWEAPTTASSPLSSPRTSSGDEQSLGYHPVITPRTDAPRDGSRAVSPSVDIPSTFASSLSSVEDLHRGSQSGRLLTLHLEKAESGIWPCLIAGPVPISIRPCLPGPPSADATAEQAYNMDPTSLTLYGLELYDIRKKKEAAFEYLVRAWHQSHVPSAALRLATYYAPPYPGYSSSEATLTNADGSPTLPNAGTSEYYVQLLGGAESVAQLYLEAGLLYLEGSAPALLQSSSSSHSLSSIRLPSTSNSMSLPDSRLPALTLSHTPGGNTPAAWRRDRQAARLFFDRARAFSPGLEVPFLPTDGDGLPGDGRSSQFQIPTIDLAASTSSSEEETILHPRPRNRRRKEAEKEEAKEAAMLKAGLTRTTEKRQTVYRDGLEEQSWLEHIPSIIGAGTAVVAVAIIGALSFQSWRKGRD